MIFKFLKIVFYATVIFFGLYFFADIRINDVNVRDYLQRTMTPQNIAYVADEVFSFARTIKEAIDKHSSEKSHQTTSPVVTKDGGEVPAEVIYSNERERLLKLKLKGIEDELAKESQLKK